MTLRLGHLQVSVDGEELCGERVEEDVPVGSQISGHLGSLFFGERTVGVVVGSQQVRRHSGREHDAAQAVLSLLGDVTGDFPAAHGEADQGHVAQIKFVHQTLEVLGQRVAFISITGRVTPPESTTVIRSQLRGQRPPVDQHDRSPEASRILDVDADTTEELELTSISDMTDLR